MSMAVIIKLRTGDGMLTVTINQPDTIVQVLDSGKAVTETSAAVITEVQFQ